MQTSEYDTAGGIRVHRTLESIPVTDAIEPVIDALDGHRGGLFASNYEYPGRYTRWDMGFVDPPLALTARGRAFRLEALNRRGRPLLPAIMRALRALPAVQSLTVAEDALDGVVAAPTGRFAEEERSRQPSIFSVLRTLIALFRYHD